VTGGDHERADVIGEMKSGAFCFINQGLKTVAPKEKNGRADEFQDFHGSLAHVGDPVVADGQAAQSFGGAAAQIRSIRCRCKVG